MNRKLHRGGLIKIHLVNKIEKCNELNGNKPCIIMPRIDSNRVSERSHRLVEFLDEHVLVAEQGVSISKVRIDLHRALEETNCDVVFFLKTEAIASRTPSLKNAQPIYYLQNQYKCKFMTHLLSTP